MTCELNLYNISSDISGFTDGKNKLNYYKTVLFEMKF